MIRHPSELFIKYLMVRPVPGYDSDQGVSVYMEQLGFPAPEAHYMAWLRHNLMRALPTDFQPANRFHLESTRWLKEQKIYGLFNPDKTCLECFQILTNLKARPIIEDMLLGRLEPKEVAKKVNARLTAFFTADVIDAYARYFWDCTLLKVDDWAVMLKSVDYRREHTLAILQVGPAMALHKHGFQQAIDSKTILQEMQETLYFDFRDWKAQPRSTDRTMALTRLARSAVYIDERLSEADSALKESLKAFEQFRMKQSEAQVRGIREIAPDGNYSNSGAKLLEPVSDEKAS
jgi:hypothetical protein